MKTKKFFALLAVLVMASMILAACAPAATEAPTEEVVATEAPPEPTVAPPPTEAPPEPTEAAEPTEPPVEEKVTLIIGTTDAISSLDPADAYSVHDWELIKNTGEGLLKWAPGTTDLQTGLAVDMPEISDDGLVYTFKLRPG
ncbi:MAG TPA: hypothetical protein VMW34_06615, partial [Anaerolineales bacterium]|nr:hypothetical protein [Anaerolineales bacterium]